METRSIVLALILSVSSAFSQATVRVDNSTSSVNYPADFWSANAPNIKNQVLGSTNGILKADGAGGVSAAVANTDYVTMQLGSGTLVFLQPQTSATNAGISLKAKGTGLINIASGDGTKAIQLTNSGVILNGGTAFYESGAPIAGLLKGNATTGVVSQAVAGTDYVTLDAGSATSWPLQVVSTAANAEIYLRAKGTSPASILSGDGVSGFVTARNAGLTSSGAWTHLSGNFTLSTGSIILTAGTYSGIGSGLTSLNANNLSSGIVPAARGGAGTINGVLKANGGGTVSAASLTDYLNVGSASSMVIQPNTTASNALVRILPKGTSSASINSSNSNNALVVGNNTFYAYYNSLTVADFATRQLYDQDENITLDWNGKTLPDVSGRGWNIQGGNGSVGAPEGFIGEVLTDSTEPVDVPSGGDTTLIAYSLPPGCWLVSGTIAVEGYTGEFGTVSLGNVRGGILIGSEELLNSEVNDYGFSMDDVQPNTAYKVIKYCVGPRYLRVTSSTNVFIKVRADTVAAGGGGCASKANFTAVRIR